MTLLIDKPAREVCPQCRSEMEKIGFFLIDDQGTRQFRCQNHVNALLRLAVEPLQTITVEM